MLGPTLRRGKVNIAVKQGHHQNDVKISFMASKGRVVSTICVLYEAERRRDCYCHQGRCGYQGQSHQLPGAGDTGRCRQHRCQRRGCRDKRWDQQAAGTDVGAHAGAAARVARSQSLELRMARCLHEILPMTSKGQVSSNLLLAVWCTGTVISCPTMLPGWQQNVAKFEDAKLRVLAEGRESHSRRSPSLRDSQRGAAEVRPRVLGDRTHTALQDVIALLRGGAERTCSLVWRTG